MYSRLFLPSVLDWFFYHLRTYYIMNLKNVHLFLILRIYISDPRVNGWPMLSSPFPTLFICLFYGYFAKTLGPRLMENRKPFQLRKVLIVYNAIQTMFSAWIFYEVSTYAGHVHFLPITEYCRWIM